jgi:hypothetical protein
VPLRHDIYLIKNVTNHRIIIIELLNIEGLMNINVDCRREYID